MTPQQLKALMEAEWLKPDCASPLRPARWRVTDFGRLSPYHDPLVADEDDGRPLDLADSR
jgi:hypothetical protein